MENAPNPKCTRCKCYWKPDESDIKSSGLVCKTCKKCRDIDLKNRCEHNKRKSRCRECNGSGFCEHNKQKSTCRECNLALYLINLQRVNLRRCFNISNLEKTNPSIEYLGCDMKYFMEYFQKKMDLFNKFSEIEMTWDNIHIDHIKPVSSFNLDDQDEFLNCCHYTNMQPLLCEINLNKSDKWCEKNEEFWLNNIQGKESIDLYLP